MSTVNTLSSIFQIAILLGLRVEACIDGEWIPASQSLPDAITPIRLIDADTNSIDQLKQIVTDFYDIIEFNASNYVFPKAAKTPGSITLMSYGFGAYVVTQKDGNLLEISLSEAQELLKDYPQKQFISYSATKFFKHFPK